MHSHGGQLFAANVRRWLLRESHAMRQRRLGLAVRIRWSGVQGLHGADGRLRLYESRVCRQRAVHGGELPQRMLRQQSMCRWPEEGPMRSEGGGLQGMRSERALFSARSVGRCLPADEDVHARDLPQRLLHG